MAESFEQKPVENPVHEVAKQETAAPYVRRWRTIAFQGTLIAAVSVFAILAFLARTVPYFSFDVTITHALQSYTAPWFGTLMRFTSTLGYFPEAPILTGLFVILLYIFGFQWESAMTLMSVVAIGALNAAVKFFVHRPRPPSSLVEVYQVLNSYSFPSGHVMYYVALYGFLLFLVFTLLKRSWIRMGLFILFSLPILLIGFSRIYLGEHWPSDVLGAYLLGGLGLIVMIAVYRWGKGRVFVRQPVAPEADQPKVEQQRLEKAVPVTSGEKEKENREGDQGKTS